MNALAFYRNDDWKYAKSTAISLLTFDFYLLTPFAMHIPFDPRYLSSITGLNRVIVADLPGLEAEVRGKRGYELVSAHALCQLIRPHAAELGLPADALDDERLLPVLFDRCFESDDAPVRALAESIRDRYARNLACLLLTLKRGDPANRAVRPEVHASYWDYWAQIQTVWLAGGLLSGHLRDGLTDRLAQHFAELNTPAPELHVSPYPDSAVLVGAACCVDADAGRALALDFGGSFVKRALASYRGRELLELRRLPALPAQFMRDGETGALFGFMVDTITQTFRGIEPPVSDVVPVSIAAYVQGGQPHEQQHGAYANLRALSDNAETLLSAAVSDRLKRRIRIRLLHDGAAAASACPADGHTAVITLGTALGLGFPLPENAHHSLAETFRIV
jgi:hypothetical protein